MQPQLLSSLLLVMLLTGCNGSTATANSEAEPLMPVAEVAADTIQEQKMSDPVQSLPVANQATRAELTKRYAEIKAMIGEAKASELQQCRKVAFGYKACGGPSSYLIYSVAGLDEALLLQKVAEYNALEQAESQRLGLISDCAVVSEPGLILEGGVCKAGSAGDLY